MFNIFKKNGKGSADDLINRWIDYCKEIGLTEDQILGLAYFNSVIPTVQAYTNKNDAIVSPLSAVVYNLGKSSSTGANVLYLYREFFFNASARDPNITPMKFGGIQVDLFSKEQNIYVHYYNSSTGMLRNSRLTTLLIQSIGKILEDYNVNVAQSFELGHFHSNFLLEKQGGFHFAESVIKSNILPEYIATAIEAIPFPNSLTLRRDIWLFSKVFHTVLEYSIDDPVFRDWLWYYHNSIFYEDKRGSTKIRSNWNLSDPNFELNMIKIVMESLADYYNSNSDIGNQAVNIGPQFKTWEEFFPLLNERMVEEFDIESPTTRFINLGEFCNYVTCKFIATVKTVFEHGNIPIGK